MSSYTDLCADAKLFKALHAAIADVAAEVHGERRTSERHAFSCVQLLAPYDGQRLPGQGEFSRVQYYDLSPSGFSYLADQRPATRRVIAALGRAPFKFFQAEVANQRVIEYEGERRLLIGCRFLSRIE